MTIAKQIFENQKKSGAPLDFTALNAAIAKAESKLAATAVSDDGKDILPNQMWALGSTITTFDSAITTAKDVLSSAKALSEINQAVEDITTATNVFIGACKAGTKDIVAPQVTGIEISTPLNDNIGRL